jgi:Cu(I)/Ag(I) efflux system membrane fusion protein
MKLVEANGSAAHEHGILVDSATVQRLGIRLAAVKRGVIGQDILTYGNVAVNENRVHTVHSRYDGWIKKLYVHSIGEHVLAGQVLYEIYSPDLIARERAYLGGIERRKQVLQTINTTADTENQYVMDLAMDAAADRARLHVEEGVSIETIKLIEDTKQAVEVAKIVAGSPGVVTQLNVREGAYAMVSTPLLTLSDVSGIWVDVALYPDQAGSVKVGDPVTVRAPNEPPIKGKLDFIAPLAENNKVQARVYLDNTKLHLRPGAFADVSIGAQPHEALILPRSAILYTAHGNLVMLSRDNGHFLPTPVETGSESGDNIEIISGVREGAEVAVNGQFLLDAASSMNAATERMRMQQP